MLLSRRHTNTATATLIFPSTQRPAVSCHLEMALPSPKTYTEHIPFKPKPYSFTYYISVGNITLYPTTFILAL